LPCRPSCRSASAGATHGMATCQGRRRRRSRFGPEFSGQALAHTGAAARWARSRALGASHAGHGCGRCIVQGLNHACFAQCWPFRVIDLGVLCTRSKQVVGLLQPPSKCHFVAFPYTAIASAATTSGWLRWRRAQGRVGDLQLQLYIDNALPGFNSLG